jgi:hypothetical protein
VSALETAFLGIARDPAVREQMQRGRLPPPGHRQRESARHIAELKRRYGHALEDLAGAPP